MSKVYFKATTQSGMDFYSGTVDYVGALASGKRVRIATPSRGTYRCCSGDVRSSDLPGASFLYSGQA